MSQCIAITKPTARISHVCSLCGRAIEPGETYSRSRMVGDDGPWVWKQCAHCNALLNVYGEEIVYDWHEGYSDEDVKQWEPDTPEGQQALAHWRAGWRGPDGALVDVVSSPAGGAS